MPDITIKPIINKDFIVIQTIVVIQATKPINPIYQLVSNKITNQSDIEITIVLYDSIVCSISCYFNFWDTGESEIGSFSNVHRTLGLSYFPDKVYLFLRKNAFILDLCEKMDAVFLLEMFIFPNSKGCS